MVESMVLYSFIAAVAILIYRCANWGKHEEKVAREEVRETGDHPDPRVQMALKGTWPPRRPGPPRRFVRTTGFSRDRVDLCDADESLFAAMGAGGGVGLAGAAFREDLGDDARGISDRFVDIVHGGIDATGNSGLTGDFSPTHSMFDDAFGSSLESDFASDGFMRGGFIDYIHGGIDPTGMGGMAGDHNPGHDAFGSFGSEMFDSSSNSFDSEISLGIGSSMFD